MGFDGVINPQRVRFAKSDIRHEILQTYLLYQAPANT